MLDKIVFGWKGTLITGVVALVVGTYGGFKGHSIKTKADKATALEKLHKAHAADLEAFQDELDESAKERIKLAEELDEAKGKTRTITREIIKEVPKYAPVSTPDCDYSVPSGLISLHNFAALGTTPDSNADEDAALDLSGSLPRSEYVSDWP